MRSGPRSKGGTAECPESFARGPDRTPFADGPQVAWIGVANPLVLPLASVAVVETVKPFGTFTPFSVMVNSPGSVWFGTLPELSVVTDRDPRYWQGTPVVGVGAKEKNSMRNFMSGRVPFRNPVITRSEPLTLAFARFGTTSSRLGPVVPLGV